MTEVSVPRHEVEYIVRLLGRVADPDGFTLRWRADVNALARYLESLVDGSAGERPRQDSSVRHAAATEKTNWDGANGTRPNGDEGLQHAFSSDDGTLCGLPRQAIVVWRHTFAADRIDACSQCREELERERSTLEE
jgi:hypothetical protein